MSTPWRSGQHSALRCHGSLVRISTWAWVSLVSVPSSISSQHHSSSSSLFAKSERIANLNNKHPIKSNISTDLILYGTEFPLYYCILSHFTASQLFSDSKTFGMLFCAVDCALFRCLDCLINVALISFRRIVTEGIESTKEGEKTS